MTFDAERIARPELAALPVYNPGKSPEDIEREYGISGCIKMASNENPLGPSPMAMDAVSKAMRDIYRYPDGDARRLKDALAVRLGVSRDSLLVASGVDEALDLVAYAFLGPGDEIVVGEPSFSSYELAALTMGARITRVPLRGFNQDVGGMLAAVTERTKVVFVCSPLNPTGSIITAASLELLLSELPESVLLLLDEAYMEYITDGDYFDGLSYVEHNPNLMVTRTFSKIYGLAGLRVGYAVCHPQVGGILNKVKLPFNVNLLAQEAALAALEDREHVQRSREMNIRGRDFIYRVLNKLGIEYAPTQANFILFRMDSFGEDYFERLLKQGIIARDGRALGFPGWVRLTIGDEGQNLKLEQALRALAS